MSETPQGWKPVEDAPYEADFCICTRDAFGLYQLPFPCRRTKRRWVNARLGVSLKLEPLGWRDWNKRPRGVMTWRT